MDRNKQADILEKYLKIMSLYCAKFGVNWYNLVKNIDHNCYEFVIWRLHGNLT